MSAETGGGKVNLTGFVAFSNGPMVLGLQADAKEAMTNFIVDSVQSYCPQYEHRKGNGEVVISPA